MISDDLGIRAQVRQKIGILAPGPSFVFFSILIMLVTYALDIMSPLGVPVWLLYFIPLFLSFWSDRYYAIPTVCGVTLLFLAAGFVFSPPGIQTSVALLMRIVFSVIIISISAVLWMAQHRKTRSDIQQAK
ncbi:MAG: hypothetical protein OS112_07870 [Methanoregula sp.]|nr:MAG: hypothetical protein OS112_07870 [Methanoregula sp.]